MTNAELSALPEPLQRVVREWPGAGWIAFPLSGGHWGIRAQVGSIGVRAVETHTPGNAQFSVEQIPTANYNKADSPTEFTRKYLRQLAADALALAGEES